MLGSIGMAHCRYIPQTKFVSPYIAGVATVQGNLSTILGERLPS